ncbi:hypothetical protein L7F22_016750 [Adiantum nelumboides]|nr:hypothetical protein [Adiantum nelumboides]
MSSSPVSASLPDTLTCLVLISDRIHSALASHSELILNRSQWQCLANSYSEVLRSPLFVHLLQHASQSSPSSLTTTLRVLREAMLEGERCMGDCTTSTSPPFDHAWLLDKALKLGASSDVVHVHLHGFLWAFSTLFVVGLHITTQTDNLESDLTELTRALARIWACENAKEDLFSACNFLTAIKCNEEGDTSCLAEFILQKLSHAQNLESVAPNVLPAYLWVDSQTLQRNPEVLGLGGYGKVHEAIWLRGRFAVKDFFYVENNEVFGREAAIQARLRHPYVVSLVCCTKKPSLHKCSLVMELMQQDLRVLMLERIETGMSPPFSLDIAVDLMLQIAQGMEYLHSLHIMHRDLKSSNILVSFRRKLCNNDKGDTCALTHLKIADFGMSKAKYASSKYTTKQVGATPWRAPEVFEINPEDETESFINSKYTKKADVYSFGLVCYEILTGNSPFEGTNVRRRVLAGERPTLPSYCPQALSSYIESCWSAEPSKRPPFSQICRVLRYIKAFVLLQDHCLSPSHMSWLSHSLTHIACAHIDDMVRSFMHPRGTLFQPQPLNIPFEMYSCSLVLQQRGDNQSIFNEQAQNKTCTAVIETSAKFTVSPKRNFGSSNEFQGKSWWKTKGHFFWRLQKLLCLGNQLAKSELLNALGLVRAFSFNELQIATVHFSTMIGEGGSGKVFYGKLEDGREIAVKVAFRGNELRSGHPFSCNEKMGLLHELRIANRLQHRHIVPLFGWCQARGNLYLVYEFMPHGNLARHIFGEPSGVILNWQQRYNIACHLASALKYLHQDSGYLQIVHRDVKATNVLLDSEWNARLGDCGLALLLRDGDDWHTLAGTIGYIAPECVAHGKVSTASDVYAFGVTILELVSGRRACSYDASSETYFVRDWAWELFRRGGLIKVADKRLEGEFEETQLKRLLLLGLFCTSADPHLRPRTGELLGMLSGASEPCILRGQPMLISAPLDKCYLQSSTGSFSFSRPAQNNKEIGLPAPYLQPDMSHRVFLYKELKLATNNFRPHNILGEGGFGNVYKGWINEVVHNGTILITVAVKVLKPGSIQGYKEWLAEVFFLSQLHHPHLVKLIGCCSEDEHRILVYEFMPNSSLDTHLFQKTKPCLAWDIRMSIALGAAKGLAFLHGALKSVIYRDFKTSNILLDAKFTAKISDFGLAKDGPAGDKTHVSTRVMGTYGYAAPEYVMTGHLTLRSDVYSFGVVLLELITGR